MNIKAELRGKKSDLIVRAKALAAIENDETEMTSEQEAEYSALTKQIGAINKRLNRQEELDAFEAKKARASKKDDDEDDDEDKKADGDDEDDDKEDDEKDDDKDDKKTGKSMFNYGYQKAPIVATPKRPRNESKGTRAARFIVGKGLAQTTGSIQTAVNWARREMNDIEVSKALNTLTQATGGAFIPQDFVADVVELLYSQTVIRAGGATVVPMPMGNLTYPRMVAGANSYWIGELDPIPTTQQAMSDLQMYAKKLVAMTPVTMDLIRRSPITVESIVLDDLKQQIGLKEDLAFLLSPGTDPNVPPGLASLGVSQVAAALPTATGTNQTQILYAINSMLEGMKLTLASQNIPLAGCKWIIPESVWTFLATVLNAFGQPVYFQNGVQTLANLPVLRTNLIPTNGSVARSGTTTTDNTTIFLVNFPDLLIGDTMQLLTDSSNIASYETGGVVKSSYQYDQMVFRTIKEVDFNVKRPQSILAMTVTGYDPLGWTGNAGLVYSGPPANTAPSFAGSANPTTVPLVTPAANTAAVIAANTTALGAPGGTETPGSGGDTYEGA